MKQEYENIKIEIIYFETSDLIMASNENDLSDDDLGDWM